MNFKVLIFLFWSSTIFCQIPLKGHITQLNEFNDSLTISDVIELDNQQKFNIPFKIEAYKIIRNKEANWIKIPIPKQTKNQYLTIENSILEVVDFYLLHDKKIIVPINQKENKQYRFPLVNIEPNNTPSILYIRTKDALSFRTEFNIKTYNSVSLDLAKEKDYFFIGGYVITLLVLLTSICVMFVYKKQYAILWYGSHLVFVIINYLINTGILCQWLIPHSIITKYGLEHIAFSLCGMSFMEFHRNFYPFTAKTIIYKKFFLGSSITFFFLATFPFIDGLLNNIFNVEIYSNIILYIIALIATIVNLILVYHKVIPSYLFIAYIIPTLGIFLDSIGLEEIFDNRIVSEFISHSVFIGSIVAVMIIVFYIIKQSIDGELKATELIVENNRLKYDFQETLSENQEKHQNALMNDVHDSFGGYLEALKLTFINKNIKDESIENILEAFSKEYRLLLNSLYIPNVNAENFIAGIEEYCNKMNEVSNININFTPTQDAYIAIPQNIAKFIYKASSELTTNAIKYAKPNFIKVQLELNTKFIQLDIIDDGIGFSEYNIKSTSYGIQGVRDRVKTFNGEMDINSTQNKGTSVYIHLPLPDEID